MSHKSIEDVIKGVSHYSFFGSFAQQRPEVLTGLNDLLNLFNITNIIEIGTHDGGISTFFALYAYLSKKPCVPEKAGEPVVYKNRTHHKLPKNFSTFDIFIRDQSSIDLIELLGGHFYKIDSFSEEGVALIKKLIRQKGRTLLLCDGGNKIKEINLFAKYLKSGDIIMGHDYFRGKKEEDAYLNKIWYGKELSWDDIKDVCEKEGIQEAAPLTEIFDPLVWFCGIKK